MRPSATLLSVIVSVACLVQGVHDDTAANMIQTLGKANYRERKVATDWLKQNPSVGSALRAALKSSDLETKRRIEAILDHYDWLRVKDLQAAVKQGNAHQFIELVSHWPKGKFEDEVWIETREFSCALVDLHHKNGGKKFPVRWTDRDTGPRAVIAKDVFDQTVSDSHPFVFLRARDVFWQESGFDPGKTIVASASVRVKAFNGGGVVFARGPVRYEGDIGFRFLILSEDDVTLKGSFFDCLVIAKGKVTCGDLHGCRIISGESVTYRKDLSRDNIISENDLNPLGFIRWTDAPKKKAAPKGK